MSFYSLKIILFKSLFKSEDISKFLKRVGRAFLEFFKIDEPNLRGVDRPNRRGYETPRKIFTERVTPLTRQMTSTTPSPTTPSPTTPSPTTSTTITPTPTSLTPSIISPFDHPPNATQPIDESITTTQNSTENAMNYTAEMTNNANSTLINNKVNVDTRVKDGQITN